MHRIIEQANILCENLANNLATSARSEARQVAEVNRWRL
jgi:hypothetical protein